MVQSLCKIIKHGLIILFFYQEPGYYEPGKFGIRLETDIEVVKADLEAQPVVRNVFIIKIII